MKIWRKKSTMKRKQILTEFDCYTVIHFEMQMKRAKNVKEHVKMK